MSSSKNKTLKVGLFVAIGSLFFILGIYYLGKMQNLFQSDIRIYSDFKDVKGLQVGNNVRYLGINIGSVTGIDIQNDSIVLVQMDIKRDMQEFIRTNSTVQINSDGLMGNRIVTISPGTANASFIDEEGSLQSAASASIKEVIDNMDKTVSYANDAVLNLKRITDKVNNGEGDLSVLLNDSLIQTTVGQMAASFKGITNKTNEILEKANSGDNDLASLLNEKKITPKLHEIVENADTITTNLKDASIEIKMASKKINRGDGLIAKLLNDSLLALQVDTTLQKVNEGIVEATLAADAIESSWLINLFSGNRRDKKKEKDN